jgi:iron complex outermembrane recepter protein
LGVLQDPGEKSAVGRRAKGWAAWLLATTVLSGIALSGAARAEDWQERLRQLESGAAPRIGLAQAGSSLAQGGAIDFNIPAGPLPTALTIFGDRAGLQILYPADLARGLASPGVTGSLTPEEALRRLLAGTPLTYRFANATTVTLERLPPEADGLPGVTQLAPVTVEDRKFRETASGPVNGYVATRSATGTKTDTPLIETPQSISVIPRERFEAQGATSVSEALAYTAGVNPSVYGPDSRYDWISIRGFDANSPGFFQDGLHARNNNTYAIWRLEPYGVERIEVLRGPGSVLFGGVNPGGLVNVVSKRPTATPQYEVQVQTGSFDRRQLAADLSGPLSDKVLYRVIGLGRESGTQTDKVDDDRLFFAPSLTWMPTTDTTLTLLSHFQRENSGTMLGFLPASGTLLPNPNGQIPRDRFVGEPDFDKFEKTQFAVGYLFEHHVSDAWSVRQNLRYGRMDLDYKEVGASGIDVGDPTQQTVARFSFTSREKVSSLAIDNQVESRFDTGPMRHTVLAGVDYQKHTFDQRTGQGTAPSLNAYNPVYGQAVDDPPLYIDSDFDLEQTGLYLQEQMKLFEKFVLVLGGRYDFATIKTDDRLAATQSEQSDGQFSGRVGVVYLSEIGLAPYASYAESFFPTVGMDPSTGQAFKPETGQQVEIGVKYQPPNHKSFVTLAAFDLHRQNYLTYDLLGNARQTGEIRSRGIEVEGVANLFAGFNVTAAYTWLPQFETTKTSNPDDLGKRLPNTAKHMASLWADYRITQGLAEGLGFGAGVRYIGETFGDFANTNEMKVPDYVLFDAAARYEKEGWRFALNMRNLTDEDYVATCSYGICYYGAGRSAVFTVSRRW